MENIDENRAFGPIDPLAAREAVRAARARMTDRLRSPWWFHALHGLGIALTVYGVRSRSAWDLLPLGIGLVLSIGLARRRTGVVGFSRANPDRWQFLRAGAPWSVIALVVAVAALTASVVLRSWTVPEGIVVATVVGLVSALTGPLADAAARRYLGRRDA
ncbi:MULTISPECIES: hypothetical protein [unclassified Curtobacterium]|uniref:hypothetical protein n=1 Tax=unclassified Curtobacterium TaxID=257496 RepID=UPI000DA7EA32|nr:MULTISPECIES: hypothetical protein [unclassified Curtobacterium]PZE27334.1 hypothetical protein DEI86_07570 [Curtobacterium sp. MCBD17_028]PZF60139.1 hypothetical protein DEI92_07110 [Curtobacterium sp. MCBD17_034]PZM34824.1 hypothetical protein DEI90_05095 [Curtobacterium sp. MCBD17_031]